MSNVKEKRRNSYDFIRFVAASAVVLSHTYALVKLGEPAISGTTSIGELGVWIFFMLSGYLIAASWLQYPRLGVFMAKRSLRIFPAVIVVVLLSVFIVGPLFTNLSLKAYFINNGTLAYLNNIFLINTDYLLPGVFNNNPLPGSVNGSLWTLAYEFLMYITIAVLGSMKALNKKTSLYLWIGLIVAQIALLLLPHSITQLTIFYLLINKLIPLSLMFFTGVVMYLYRDKIKLSIPAGFAAIAVFVLLTLALPPMSPLFACILLSYGLFALGGSPTFSKFGKHGDFSYGIYIYHFLILQIIIAAFGITSPGILFAIAWPTSILLGFLSWRFIESKALNLKNKIDLKKYPL